MEEIKLQSKILTEKDRTLVKSLTEELIVAALDHCDDLVSCNWDKSLDDSSFSADSSDRLLEKSNGNEESGLTEHQKGTNCLCRSISSPSVCDCQETTVSKSRHRPLQHTRSEVDYLKHVDLLGGYADVVRVIDVILGTTANKPPAEQMSFMKTCEELLGNSCKDAGVLEVRKHADEFNAISEVQIAFTASGESETMDRMDEGDGFHRSSMPDNTYKEMKDEALTEQSPASDSSSSFVSASTDSGIVMSVSSKSLDMEFLDSTSDVACTCNNCLTKNSTFDSVSSQTTNTIKNASNALGSCSFAIELTTDIIAGDSAGGSIKSDLLMSECLYFDCVGVGGIPIEETVRVLNGSADVGIMPDGLDTDYFSIPLGHINDLSTKIELNTEKSDEDSGIAAGSKVDIMSNDQSSSCLETLSDFESCKEAPMKTRPFVSSLQYVKEKIRRDEEGGRLMSRSHLLKAAISTDSRMYNTLTFLDDESDEGEGNDADKKDHISPGQDNKTAGGGTSEQLDNMRNLQSDINDNPEIPKDSAQPEDQNETSARKKIVPNFELLRCDDLDLNFSPKGSVPDLHLGDYYGDRDCTPDDIDLSGDLANAVFDPVDDWGDDLDDQIVDPIPEYTAREEYEDAKNWRPVEIAGATYRIDMRAIEPYKKVLSHGGYYGNGLNAIVVFAACYLPDRTRLDYRYIMDNLFLYVVSVLELLVVENYTVIYFHGAASRSKVPALRWLKRCYDMTDHRLRKNLQRLLVVHPTFFLKTLILMTRPFISSKFALKLHYVRSLSELSHLIPTEYIHLPDEVIQLDKTYNPTEPIPHKKFVNL